MGVTQAGHNSAEIIGQEIINVRIVGLYVCYDCGARVKLVPQLNDVLLDCSFIRRPLLLSILLQPKGDGRDSP